MCRAYSAVSGTRIQLFDGGWKVVSVEDLEEMIASYIPIFCDNLDEDIQQLSSDTLPDQATHTFQDESTSNTKGNTTPSTHDRTSSSSSEAPQQVSTRLLNDLIQ